MVWHLKSTLLPDVVSCCAMFELDYQIQSMLTVCVQTPCADWVFEVKVVSLSCHLRSHVVRCKVQTCFLLGLQWYSKVFCIRQCCIQRSASHAVIQQTVNILRHDEMAE